MSYEVLEVPPPRLAAERVPGLVETHWGVTGDVRPLSSERDLNSWSARHVLKVANPAEDPALVDMEVAAMRHVSGHRPGPPDPAQVVPATDGSDVVTIVDDDGRACLARLITVVPGTPLEGHVVTEDLAEQVGAATARTAPRCVASSTRPAAAASSTGRYAPCPGRRGAGGTSRRTTRSARSSTGRRGACRRLPRCPAASTTPTSP